MLNTSMLKAVPLMVGLLCLGACATTGGATSAAKTTTTAEKTVEAKSAKEAADKLTQAQRTTKSEDGKMICKRTTVVGSKFNKKVCATAEEWDARADEDRRTAGNLQRRGGAPGRGN